MSIVYVDLLEVTVAFGLVGLIAGIGMGVWPHTRKARWLAVAPLAMLSTALIFRLAAGTFEARLEAGAALAALMAYTIGALLGLVGVPHPTRDERP